MENYLPEVFDTVKNVVSVDKGNLFDRSLLFPKRAEKRLEAQKEILKFVAECNKEITLTKLEVEKEIHLAELNLSYEVQKLKYETLCQLCNTSDPDRLSRVGDIISRL